MLSQRALSLKPSPTMAMAAKAKELQTAGHDVVSLTVGEPDWQTFPAANEAAIEAIKSGFTKYTVVAGIPELRTAIAQNIQDTIGIKYGLKEVTVGAGAKFVIFAALQMLIDDGDEVIIPAPYWVSYPTMVELAGGRPICVNTTKESRFKMTATQLKAAITPKTKALIMCSPSNPTGIAYTAKELSEIAEVLRAHPKVVLISDDIYNRLVFTHAVGKGVKVAPHILQVAPELKSRTIVVNGASKAYSMTGWRIGWGMGPEAVITAMSDYMSQSTSNVTSISQKAALAALQKSEPDVLESVIQLEARMNWFYSELEAILPLKPIKPDGAFYIWLDITGIYGKIVGGVKMQNSADVAKVLLEQFHVATVPGSDFGTEGYLRLSFATSKVTLQKALDRFKKLVAQ